MSSARSIGILTILNIAGAVIAVANSVVVAQLFGTSRALEIYFAAATLEMMVLNLTQTGQLAEIFLPIYHRIKEANGIETAQRAFSIILNWMIIFVFVLATGLWILAPIFLRLLVPGFGAEDKVLGVVMFRWILPLLGLQVIFSLVQTLANAEKWFGKPEAVAIGTRLIIIVSIGLLARPLGIWALVAAMWIGQGFQFLGYVLMLYRMRYRHRLRLRQDGFSAWSVFKKLFVTFGYVGATQVYAFTLNAGLSLLPQGTYAVFKYVQQLYTKTYTILLRPVSVVFFTYISEALARGAKNVRVLAQQALARCLGIGVLVVVPIMVAGRPLLGGLWGSERFGPENLDLAARLLKLFYLLIFASALGQIGRKTVMSLGMVQRQYLLASAMQLISAAVVWLLIKYYNFNGAVAGVIFAVVGLNMVFLLPLMIWRRNLLVIYNVWLTMRWAAASVAGYFAGKAIMHTFLIDMPSARLPLLGTAALLAGISVFSTVGVAWLLRIYEVTEALRRFRLVISKTRYSSLTAKNKES